jgi:hypothetical protein
LGGITLHLGLQKFGLVAEAKMILYLLPSDELHKLSNFRSLACFCTIA